MEIRVRRHSLQCQVIRTMGKDTKEVGKDKDKEVPMRCQVISLAGKLGLQVYRVLGKSMRLLDCSDVFAGVALCLGAVQPGLYSHFPNRCVSFVVFMRQCVARKFWDSE